MAKRSSITKTAVWVLMGLLILGLGGFGAINLSGNIRTIGTVGEKSIPVDQYARQLQQEIRAIEAQTGEPLNFQRAQEIGLDRAVLQRIVRNRALDNEADVLGISIGDEALREEVLKIGAFQGIDGEFDREGYRFALEQGGVSEAEFETSLREEASRTLLQGAIVSGVKMPDAYARTLVDYVGETRDFTWSLLDEADLTDPVTNGNLDDLKAYYDANAEDFMLPPSKQITYALLSPDSLLEQVEVPEEELRQEYENRADEYNKPERRLVERLVFSDQESADQAAAALEVNATTFEALVQERGLALADVDLGDVGRMELGTAGEAVFDAEAGDIVGPAASPLGPAMFRVNGVLPAQNVSYEDALPDLQQALATARAVRAVEAQAQNLDDQLAGGATLEQLAEESDMTLGTIDWTEDTSDGIAAYADFRQEAAALAEGDFPKILQLDDGSVYAMRLDAALDARPNPFDAAKADVRVALRTERLVAQLTAQADTLTTQLTDGTSFADAGLDGVVEEGQRRNGFIEAAPADLMAQVFEMEPGEVRVLPGSEDVAIVRLDAVNAAGETDQSKALLAQLGEQLNQQLAQDLFNIFASDVVRRTAPQIDQRAINAVHVNFP